MADELAQFRATYIAECKELVKDMEESLVNLDQESADTEALNAIFRCAHSIKGGAGAFNLTRLAAFTHILEAVLDQLRTHKLSVTQDLVDILLESVDVLSQMIDKAEANQPIPDDMGRKNEEDLTNVSNGTIQVSSKVEKVAVTTSIDQSKLYSIKFYPHEKMLQRGNEPLLIIRELAEKGDINVRCDVSKLPKFSELDPHNCYLNFNIELDSNKPESDIRSVFEFVEDDCDLEISEFAGLFSQNEEKQDSVKSEEGNKDIANQNTSESSKNEAQGKSGQQQAAVNSIRVDIEKIDKLVNLVGELVITQAMIAAQTKNLAFDQFSALITGVEDLSHHTRELQDAVMSVRMQPVKSLFSRMPRLVRDLSRKLGKDIKLELYGENTEVDKTIIEQLSDPLVHMIRNSVDHGVELPDSRVAKGKPAQGTIKLSADQISGKIVITIDDDGKGIDREKVLAKAIEKNVVTREAAELMTPQEIDMLIFAAGFSTADAVTDVSGRGVGMDVVRKNIESIGGFIEMQNNPGVGLKVHIYIPLTLAILDGMIVGVGKENYIIPINNIIETLRPRAEDVKEVIKGNDVINLRGEFIQVLYLNSLFGIINSKNIASEALVVIVETNNNKYGLVVDELIGQQQVVIKSLDENSKSIDGISGATILGDGKVSLILDMVKLNGLAQKRDQMARRAA